MFFHFASLPAGKLQPDDLAAGDVTAEHVRGGSERVRGTAGGVVRPQWRPDRVQRQREAVVGAAAGRQTAVSRQCRLSVRPSSSARRLPDARRRLRGQHRRRRQRPGSHPAQTQSRHRPGQSVKPQLIDLFFFGIRNWWHIATRLVLALLLLVRVVAISLVA